MTKDTWTKIRRLLSRAVKRTRPEAAKADLPGHASATSYLDRSTPDPHVSR